MFRRAASAAVAASLCVVCLATAKHRLVRSEHRHQRGEELSRALPLPPGGQGVFVAFLSAAKNVEKRRQVRRQCIPSLKDHGIPYKFFVGRPDRPAGSPTSQGAPASEQEVQAAGELRREDQEHHDLYVVPYLDHYVDLSDKTTALFGFGLDEGYDLIAKVDDDACPAAATLKALVGNVTENLALYAGLYPWQGTEYLSQKGVTGERVPYFSGSCYALSRKLAAIVFRESNLDTELFQDYGTNAEDNNMGHWYNHAQSKYRNDTRVKFLRRTERSLCEYWKAK